MWRKEWLNLNEKVNEPIDNFCPISRLRKAQKKEKIIYLEWKFWANKRYYFYLDLQFVNLLWCASISFLVEVEHYSSNFFINNSICKTSIGYLFLKILVWKLEKKPFYYLMKSRYKFDGIFYKMPSILGSFGAFFYHGMGDDPYLN